MDYTEASIPLEQMPLARIFGMYMGHYVLITKNNKPNHLGKIGKLESVFKGGEGCLWVRIEGEKTNEVKFFEEVVLLLRPLDQITKEEKRQLATIAIKLHENSEYNTPFYNTLLKEAKKIEYLISLGLDVFELIEKGIAKDISTVEKNYL